MSVPEATSLPRCEWFRHTASKGEAMSLDAYRERVRKLASARKGDSIVSGNLDHAAIITETLFANARRSVCILSHKMNARVYGPKRVLEQAELFLADASHKVCILLEDPNPSDMQDHPFFEEFSHYKNVLIRSVPEKWQSQYSFHFVVADADSYRFEQDKTTHAAIAAFGDRKGGENMAKIFQILWDKGERVQLPERRRVAVA